MKKFYFRPNFSRASRLAPDKTELIVPNDFCAPQELKMGILLRLCMSVWHIWLQFMLNIQLYELTAEVNIIDLNK